MSTPSRRSIRVRRLRRIYNSVVDTNWKPSVASMVMITPEQCRMARSALRIGVRDLAGMSGVTFATISRFETGASGGRASTRHKLQSALEAAGIEFIPENGGSGVGVRFRTPEFYPRPG